MAQDWGIPQDSSIGPPSLKAKLNTINAQPTAINANSSFPVGSTGSAFIKAGAEAGNPEYGARYVSKLLQGIQKAGSDGGYFLDEAGKTISTGGLTHEQYLMQNDMMPSTREAGTSELAQALRNNKLIRIRETPENIGVELAHAPTAEQLSAVAMRLSKTPMKPVNMDLWKPGDVLSKAYASGANALKDLMNFFSGPK